jgi:hypothetical protein
MVGMMTSCSHEYTLKVKSIPKPGSDTRRYIYQHDFKADSIYHAEAYAQGMAHSFHGLSRISTYDDPTESAYIEGYMAGEHLSVNFPRNFDIIIEENGNGWRASIIIDK